MDILFRHFDWDTENNENFENQFRESIDNTFMILTGRKTYIDIVSEMTKKPHIFLFDPTKKPTIDDVKELIEIYEDYEEYEKCGELQNLVNGFRKKN